MIFLGTGAAAGIPNPFCECPVCNNARKVKGKEIRTRSCFLLDEEIMIDLSADYLTQCADNDVHLSNVKHILFTHTHDDHLNHTFLWERYISTQKPDNPVNVYLVEDAYKYIEDFYSNSPIINDPEKRLAKENCLSHKLEFNKTIKINDYSITPLKARHRGVYESNGANYLIEKDGMKLYYALDSGYFFDETFDALKDKNLDIFIGECTATRHNFLTKQDTHMDLDLCVENLNHLYELNAINKNTKVYLSHFGDYDYNHEQLVEYFNSLELPYEVIIAYDGLKI